MGTDKLYLSHQTLWPGYENNRLYGRVQINCTSAIRHYIFISKVRIRFLPIIIPSFIHRLLITVTRYDCQYLGLRPQMGVLHGLCEDKIEYFSEGRGKPQIISIRKTNFGANNSSATS